MQGYEEDSINLLDILVRLLAKWRTFLVTALISVVIGVVMIYRIQPLYESNVSILPSAAAEEANSLSAIFTGRHSGDIYVGLLHSRAVVDDVIRRMDLRKVYGTGGQDATRGKLWQNTRIGVGGDSILVLVVRDADAALATKIANSYLDALEDQQVSMATSASRQRRQFYATQLQQEKDALLNAEEDLRRTQESLGIVQIGQQTSIGISAIADMRAQITASQVRLASLLLSETEQNPEVRTLRTQIAQLEAQERSLSAGRTGGPVGAAMPAGRMPAANLEYQRKDREVQYHTALFNSLSHELENARMSEAAAGQTFQVVDRAVIPEFRVWPNRRMLLLLTYAVSLFLGLLAVALEILVERILRDPENRNQLNALRKQFHLGR
jgi:tyrosine-protein kinase Etk/Wzc